MAAAFAMPPKISRPRSAAIWLRYQSSRRSPRPRGAPGVQCRSDRHAPADKASGERPAVATRWRERPTILRLRVARGQLAEASKRYAVIGHPLIPMRPRQSPRPISGASLLHGAIQPMSRFTSLP